MTTPRRCAIYARISVTKEESVSIERQLDSCRRYAQARNWEIVGEFIDDGVSASLNRPESRKGWNELLRVDGYEAVVIWKVDRLARKVLDFLNADRALQDRGAGLVAVEDPVDMTTAQGRAFATILAVFGEMEAEGIRARVKAARAHLVKQGRWAGGGIPYGWRSIDHPGGVGKWIEKDPDRIKFVAGMVRRYQAGATINSVAAWLDEVSAPLPKKRSTGDTQWNRQTVDAMLRNPILAGMLPYNPGRPKSGKRGDPFAVRRDDDGDPIIYDDLAIISFDEFAEIQERINTPVRPQHRRYAERQHTTSFLARVAVCDKCDRYLYRGTNQKRPMLYCPKCRQTLSRTTFEPWLTEQLLAICGYAPMKSATVRDHWPLLDDDERRTILLEHLESLRIRRGVVGRYFDEDRIILRWRDPVEEVA